MINEDLPIETDLPTHDDTLPNALEHNYQHDSLQEYPDKVGTPEKDAHDWEQQSTPFSCVPKTEQGILKSFGEHLSEAHLCTEAAEHGRLTSTDGISIENVGKELELHGIDTHSVKDATIGDIVYELAHGHKVIAGVKAEKLLGGANHPFHGLNGEGANHAIWVTGIDKTDPNDIKIIVNDSADPHGAAKEYSLQQFKDAWKDSGYFYVATDKAPSNLHDIVPSFDQHQGVFPDMVKWLHENIPDSQTMFTDMLIYTGIKDMRSGSRGANIANPAQPIKQDINVKENNYNNKLNTEEVTKAKQQIVPKQLITDSNVIQNTINSNTTETKCSLNDVIEQRGFMKYDHQKLAEAVERFSDLSEVKQQPEILASYQWQIDRWREGLYTLVVVGEVKKGKSSFVNALLEGEGLSPVADKIASAVPVKFVYGKSLRYQVHFLPDENGDYPKPLEISSKDLPKYATEQGISTEQSEANAGNFGNRFNVDYVSVEHPHRFLKEGLVVVDLPGLGGVFKHHARLVWEYLNPERADHIAFVFDSTGNPFAAEEKSAIQEIKKREIDRFMFLQTKTDCSGSEQIQAWKKTNLRELSSLLEMPETDIKYFLISNFLKQEWLRDGDKRDLKHSGFVELEQYLSEDLMPAKKDLLAIPVWQGLSIELHSIEQQLEVQRKIYQEDSAEKRKDIYQAYQRKDQEFKNWKNSSPLKTELMTALRKARIDAVERIQNELNPARITTPIYTELQSCKTEKEVLLSQENAKQRCLDTILQHYEKIFQDYRVATETAYTHVMKQLDATMPTPFIDQHQPDLTDIVTITIPLQNKTMQTIQRSWPMAALAATVGSIVAGPLVAIGAGLAALYKVLVELREGNREVALNRLKGIMNEAIPQALNRVSSAMNKTFEQTESEFIKQLENAAQIRYQRFTENLETAKQQLNNTDADIANQLGLLDKKQINVNEIKYLLRTSAELN